MSKPTRFSRIRGITVFLAAAGATFLAGCTAMSEKAALDACNGAVAEVVCTTQGAVQGIAEGATVAFKGIPYAAPPVGKLRWHSPQPARPWTGTRDATKFGAVCPQMAGDKVIGSEDCLTLNVWRPQGISKKLPVMVFLTGGGNHVFSGQGSPGFGGVNYNGQHLAPEGVVYVSFNNRLGALGFLTHPTLDRETPAPVSGNYGSQDQIAVLQWVQQNIAAFGGDPTRVMLFGTSAGGGSICALMTAPKAEGLFHRAAMQSSVPTGCELPTLSDAQKSTGLPLAKMLGCENDSTAACLRTKSAEEIVRTMPGRFGMAPRQFGPIVDGKIFPEQPIKSIQRQQHSSMPIIIGNSSDETMQWAAGLGEVTDAASYDKAIIKGFGTAEAARIREAYPLASYPTPHAAIVRMTTDAFFTCQSRRVANELSRAQSQPVYRYLFTHSLKNDPALQAQGAIHTVEHPFFFAWEGTYKPTARDLNIQVQMVKDWTELARSGEVRNGLYGVWPRAKFEEYLEIGTPMVVRNEDRAKCDFWDTVELPWPHL